MERIRRIKSAISRERAVFGGVAGWTLEPVNRGVLADAGLLNVLSDWRTASKEAFLTVKDSTVGSLTGYLEQHYFHDDRRLNFTAFLDEQPAATTGLSGISATGATIENVLKGGGILPKDFMATFVGAVMDIARDDYGSALFDLKVRSDNLRAIAFYRKIGFDVTAAKPLSRLDIDGGYQLVDPGIGAATPISLLTMVRTATPPSLRV